MNVNGRNVSLVVLKDEIVVLGPGLGMRLKSLVLSLMCYDCPNTIDCSYILPDDGRVIHIPTNKQGCCHWPWSSVFLKDKVVLVLCPGLGFSAQTFVKIPG